MPITAQPLPCRTSSGPPPVPRVASQSRAMKGLPQPLRCRRYGTVSDAIDLIGQYEDTGIELLIIGDRNDEESRELFVTDVIPHFA
jgi:hypothetical protein